MEQLADTDPLTGLWNRRYLDRRLAELTGRPLALTLLDLDHFKQVNDRFSHDAGDAVLRRLADLLRLEAGSDPSGHAFAARLGGEEFVLVLPAATGDLALRHCERIRTQMQASDWGPLAGRLVVTVSIGLALDAQGTAEASELLSRADSALYEAKATDGIASSPCPTPRPSDRTETKSRGVPWCEGSHGLVSYPLC